MCLWCFIWSVVAVILAALLLSAVVAMMASAEMTARGANNLVLAIILTIAAIFFAVVWLLRRSKVLFIRTSRAVLFVCTCLGLFIGVPISIAGVWEPEDTSNDQVKQTAGTKKIKRYQYMVCTDLSYRHYTDEQMKNPNVGFIDGGKDYCLEDGKSKMLKLVESRSEADQIRQEVRKSYQQANYHAPSSSGGSQESCETVRTPYKVVKKPASWLSVGETSVINGDRGYTRVCRNAQGKVISRDAWAKPIDEIVYYGTREPRSYPASSSSECDKFIGMGMSNSTYYGDCLRGY